MRELKFRARFQHIATRETIWQYVAVYGSLQLYGFVQKTNWEQLTGLSDKNGVEIYEGDIIECRCGKSFIDGSVAPGEAVSNYEIRWQKEKGRWGRWKNGKFELLSGLDETALHKWYSVIGNIHENKSLLDDQ